MIEYVSNDKHLFLPVHSFEEFIVFSMIALREDYRDTIVIEELLVIRYRCLLARYPRRIVFMHIKYRDVVDRWTLRAAIRSRKSCRVRSGSSGSNTQILGTK